MIVLTEKVNQPVLSVPVALVLTKQAREDTPKTFLKNRINKQDVGKKNTQQKSTKPKPSGLSAPVRSAHMCVLMTVYNCGTQYSTEQF